MTPPRGSFAASSGAFLRLLGVVHVVAFASFWHQWRGLVGPDGIEPAGRFFAAVKAQIGLSSYWRLPSLCWWLGTNHAIPWLCALGLLAALLVCVGVAPALCLGFLWVDYLSLVAVGQVFYRFQWDELLLEATLISVFLAPWAWLPLWRNYEPPRVARWLIWWLLARLMFLSGVVKLTSGDTSWTHLTALAVHFQTQPLPTPAAWYLHHWPAWLLRGCCGVMFAIELACPVLIVAPRRVRHVAAGFLILLQGVIAITGNYTFFNLLTAALCVTLFERKGDGLVASLPAAAERRQKTVVIPFAWIAVILTTLAAVADFSPSVAMYGGPALSLAAPFESFNTYGLFRVMTPTRPELIFQGSDDGRDWKDYAFPDKPGDLNRRPTYVAPAQPRLDWQLWFAALEPREYSPWVDSLVERLLRNRPEVLALIRSNPFPDHPPKYIRILRFEYRFSTPADRTATGRWWQRTFLDLYQAPVSLNPPP